ncbi:MAG TPA: hypothetical protein VJY33_08900, partial [Isosphaeraceae bacterium]|nr:hypothetical protein [Isosphaeraceae bacterium]
MMRSGLFLVFFLLTTTLFAFSQSIELKGIKTVNVAVAELSDDLVQDGVEKEVLTTTLELALRRAGLTVLTQPQYDGTVPTISLQVSAIKEPNGRFYATDVVLTCLDNVYDNRTAGPFSASIWSKDVLQLLGVIDLSRLVEAERKLIE